MAEIRTKYSIGDKVFLDHTKKVQKRLPCPDCLGSECWETTSPAGVTYTFDCPRCRSTYKSDLAHTLDYSWNVPDVTELTIGSIQFDSNAGEDQKEKYMCKETGVGSGRVYKACDLYLTREEALASSTRKAGLENTDKGSQTCRTYHARLDLSDYQLNCIPKAKKGRKR